MSTLEPKEIKTHPWESSQPGQTKSYQCDCSEKKKLELLKRKSEDDRTSLSNGKILKYQDISRSELDFDTKSEIQNFDLFQTKGWSIQKFKFSDESLSGQFLKTFQLCYKKQTPLSLTGRNILNSFQNKYIYYAIDDILYLLSSNPTERDQLLTILYSSMLSLHNEFTVNFFDIWIDSVYLNDSFQTNRFCNYQNNNFNNLKTTTIVLKLHYFTRSPIRKPDPLW